MSEGWKEVDVIYLQIREFPEITWCADKINDDDIKYLRATPEREKAEKGKDYQDER